VVVVGYTIRSRGYLPGKEPETRIDGGGGGGGGGGDDEDDVNTKLGVMGRGM
jgi:hypothetical protein